MGVPASSGVGASSGVVVTASSGMTVVSSAASSSSVVVPMSSSVMAPPDADADTVPDASDNCPAVANAGQEDQDGDGAGDACDNCGTVANAGQENGDGDALGNACDPRPGAGGDVLVLDETFPAGVPGTFVSTGATWSTAPGGGVSTNATGGFTRLEFTGSVPVNDYAVHIDMTPTALGTPNAIFGGLVRMNTAGSGAMGSWDKDDSVGSAYVTVRAMTGGGAGSPFGVVRGTAPALNVRTGFWVIVRGTLVTVRRDDGGGQTSVNYGAINAAGRPGIRLVRAAAVIHRFTVVALGPP